MGKKSKGDWNHFVHDGTKDAKLRKAMISVAKSKNISAETLLSEFHKRDYKGVTITDCRKILKTLEKPGELQRLDEWHY